MDISNDNKETNSTAEISNGMKEIDLNCNDDLLEDDAYMAPFEILAEFLSTLMARDYRTALIYCKLILQYEPDNKIAQDFYPLIQQKINIEAETSQFDFHPASEENENKDSDDSAEYYSSASGREDEEEGEEIGGGEGVSSATSLSSSGEEEDDNSL